MTSYIQSCGGYRKRCSHWKQQTFFRKTLCSSQSKPYHCYFQQNFQKLKSPKDASKIMIDLTEIKQSRNPRTDYFQRAIWTEIEWWKNETWEIISMFILHNGASILNRKFVLLIEQKGIPPVNLEDCICSFRISKRHENSISPLHF